MQFAARTTLVQDGQAREFATAIDLEDIDANGVAWSQSVRQSAPGSPERLAALLNCATVCREHGRPLAELCALRMARRMSGGAMEAIVRRIEEIRGAGRFDGQEDEPLRIVACHEDPGAFGRLLGSGTIVANFHHPGAAYQGLTGLDGRPVLPPDPTIDNVSFAVCRADRRLAVVPCVIQRDDNLSWVAPHLPGGGIPIRLHWDEPVAEMGRVIDLVLRYLDHLLRSCGARQFVIRECADEGLPIYKALGRADVFSAEIWDRPVVALDPDENALFAQVRKSYKNHINWGRENLAMEYLSGERLAATDVERVYQAIQACHAELIRKYGDGMSPALFMQPMVMCQMGRGEAAIATTRDGTICGVVVTTDAGDVSNYALGGSIAQGNKNPGQFIVFDAIVRAKRRGARHFHMNREFSAPVFVEQLQARTKSVHDMNLIFFKRGFGGTLDAFPVYKVLPRGSGFLGR